MIVQVPINDIFANGSNDEELQREIKEGLAIRKYLKAKISIGELAEILGTKYMEARDWLHAQGIPTSRKFSPELEKVLDDNMNQLIEELGV